MPARHCVSALSLTGEVEHASPAGELLMMLMMKKKLQRYGNCKRSFHHFYHGHRCVAFCCYSDDSSKMFVRADVSLQYCTHTSAVLMVDGISGRKNLREISLKSFTLLLAEKKNLLKFKSTVK